MAGIDELSRVIGGLEERIVTLFHQQDTLCKEVKTLSKNLQNRKLWDSVKIITGAFLGGAAAILAKTAIWK